VTQDGTTLCILNRCTSRKTNQKELL